MSASIWVRLAAVLVLAGLAVQAASAGAADPQSIIPKSPSVSTDIPDNSQPMMPGDRGFVTVTVSNAYNDRGSSTITTTSYSMNSDNGGSHTDTDKNTVAGDPNTYSQSEQYSENKDTAQSGHNVQETVYPSGVVTLKEVRLHGSGPVHVAIPVLSDLGALSPGTERTFQFPVTVDENASDGYYTLELDVKAGEGGAFLKEFVTVAVDGSPLLLDFVQPPIARDDGIVEVMLNVINPRENDVSSVSVIPHGAGFEFSPMEELFIGDMRPQDQYPLTFYAYNTDETGTGSFFFELKYRSGTTWHSVASGVKTLRLSRPDAAAGSDTETGLIILGGSVLVVACLAGIAFVLIRRGRKKA